MFKDLNKEGAFGAAMCFAALGLVLLVTNAGVKIIDLFLK